MSFCEVNLTRANHDFLLDMNLPLLQRLFDSSKAQWNLAGCRFPRVPADLAIEVEECLGMDRPDEGPEFPAGEFAPQANVGPRW
jgi:hypothetical protein